MALVALTLPIEIPNMYAPDVIIDGINFGNKFDPETAEDIFHNLDYIDPEDTEKMLRIYEEDCIFRDSNMKWCHEEGDWFRPGESLILETYYPHIEVGRTWLTGRVKVDEDAYTTRYMNEPIMNKTEDGQLVWVYCNYSSFSIDGLEREIFYEYFTLPTSANK